ncbi:MAG: hypothetical protein SF162_17125 [bacterium]|nr:hypothetical protein [bacterium]
MGSFEYAYTLSGADGLPAVHDFPVAATQTLKTGDLVELSSGQVIKSTGNAAAPLGVMAQDSASAAAGTRVRVYPILPGQVWRAFASGSPTSAILGARRYDITNAGLVDLADSTSGAILIVKAGRAGNEVYITFTRCALIEIGS